MRGVGLVIAALVLGIWSLFCRGVYGLLGFASANLGLLPFPPEIVLWTVDVLGGLGAVAVWIVWALGAAVIAIFTLIPLAFLPRRGRLPPRMPPRDLAPAASDREPYRGQTRSADEIVAGVLGRSRRSDGPPR